MSRLGLVVLSVILLAACGTPPPVPDDHYYRLETRAAGSRFDQPVFDGVLLVERPAAAGVRRGRKMLYSDDPGHLRFQQYHYHHWEDAVPHLLHRWLDQWLEASGVASEVKDRPHGQADYRLQTRIARFERLIDGGRYAAAVSLEFILLPAGSNAPLLRETLAVVEPADGNSVEATVRAFGRALDQVADQLSDRLAALEGP